MAGAAAARRPRERIPLTHLCQRAAGPAAAGDLVVVNNTRVFPARLLGRRDPSGGAVECLLVRPLPGGSDPGLTLAQILRGEIRDRVRPGSDPGVGAEPTSERWEALVHPGQKLKPGARVVFEGIHTIHGEILERRHFGRRIVRLWTDDGSPLGAAVDASATCRCRRASSATTAPMIVTATRRSSPGRAARSRRRRPASTSRPADGGAGRSRRRDHRITLHVGYGTFSRSASRASRSTSSNAALQIGVPRRHDQPRPRGRPPDHRRGDDHHPHPEAVAAITTGRSSRGRGPDLFLPGRRVPHRRRAADELSPPQSSLLMLVSAFAGDLVKSAYREAIAERYPSTATATPC